MVDFKQSTHYLHWFMSPEKLQEELIAKTELSQQKLAKYIDFRLASDSPNFAKEKENLVKLKGATSLEKAKPFDRPDVENLIVIYFCDSIRVHLSKIPKPNVIITAISYFQRFYLHQGINCVDPSKMVYACLFLASKVEELSMTHDEFCHRLQKDPKAMDYLVYHEQLLLRGLKYQLHVLTPIQAAMSLVTRCDNLLRQSPQIAAKLGINSEEEITKFRQTLNNKINAKIYDAYFIRQVVFCFSPTVIALACFDLFLKEGQFAGFHEGLASAQDFIKLTFNGSQCSQFQPEVWAKVAQVSEHLKTLEKGLKETLDQGKQLNKKVGAIQAKVFSQFKQKLLEWNSQEFDLVEPAGFWSSVEGGPVLAEPSQSLKRTAEQAGIDTQPEIDKRRKLADQEMKQA